MNRSRARAIWHWSVRDLSRHPVDAVLMGVAVYLLVGLTATPLLLGSALKATAERIYAESPSLVIRRVGAGGWMPIPVAQTKRRLAPVAGITSIRPRIWGAVSLGGTPVILMGAGGETGSNPPGPAPIRPAPGTAVIGAGIAPAAGSSVITLSGAETRSFQITRRLPPSASILLHDVIVAHPADARSVLGLAAEDATDMAVDVFHDTEQRAIVDDIVAALPFPIRVMCRLDAAGADHAGIARWETVLLSVMAPALLAVVLLTALVVRHRLSRRQEMMLMKAMGWTTGNITSFLLMRTAAVVLPALSLGYATAYALVAWPGIRWPADLMFRWPGPPPPLYLVPADAAAVMLVVALAVLLPLTAAVILPVARLAAQAPLDGPGDFGP